MYGESGDITTDEPEDSETSTDTENPTVPDAGAAIRVAYDGGHDSYDVYTNASGRATLTNLKSGTYTVTEIAAPDGYILNDTPQTIKLESGKTATITLTNEAKPGIVIKKYD